MHLQPLRNPVAPLRYLLIWRGMLDYDLGDHLMTSTFTSLRFGVPFCFSSRRRGVRGHFGRTRYGTGDIAISFLPRDGTGDAATPFPPKRAGVT